MIENGRCEMDCIELQGVIRHKVNAKMALLCNLTTKPVMEVHLKLKFCNIVLVKQAIFRRV